MLSLDLGVAQCGRPSLVDSCEVCKEHMQAIAPTIGFTWVAFDAEGWGSGCEEGGVGRSLYHSFWVR